EQQARTPARGVLFLARDPVARAHRALVATAFANADTADRNAAEATLVVWKYEVGRGLGRMKIHQPQVFIELVRIDDLTGIHLPVRIPDRLEFAKRLQQLL